MKIDQENAENRSNSMHERFVAAVTETGLRRSSSIKTVPPASEKTKTAGGRELVSKEEGYQSAETTELQ